MKQRLARLLAADVNLFAYHLPLDAHPQLGNNAQLASSSAGRQTSAVAIRTWCSAAHCPKPLRCRR